MKIGDKIKLTESGKVGEITSIIDGKVTHMKDLSTGEIVEVVNDAFVLIGVIKKLLKFFKSIFKR